MKELEKYIEQCLFYCKKSAGEAKEIHLAHAYGAVDFYTATHPREEDACKALWKKWYSDFTENIWGYRA